MDCISVFFNNHFHTLCNGELVQKWHNHWTLLGFHLNIVWGRGWGNQEIGVSKDYFVNLDALCVSDDLMLHCQSCSIFDNQQDWLQGTKKLTFLTKNFICMLQLTSPQDVLKYPNIKYGVFGEASTTYENMNVCIC